MARRSYRRSAPRRSSAGGSSNHMSLLLLAGGAAAAYLYTKQQAKKAAIQSLSTVPPVLAASQATTLPQDQLTQDTDTVNSLAPSVLNGFQRSGALPGMGSWRQPSGALPGMGSFHLSHVINTVIAKPIAQLTQGPLKVPLAIMTLGQSAIIGKAVEAVNAGITATISKIDDPLMKAKQMVMSVVGGKAQPPANTAGTTITYLDCNGAPIDLPTIQSQLSALAAVGGATSITPTVDASGNAVYRMPACPPAAGVTTSYPAAPGGNPAPVLTQYPAGTPINPYTGTPYINPATGQPYPVGTVIDPNTGMPTATTLQPTVATGTQINYATGLPYPIGTPMNAATGQAYINPSTGQPWPPYTTIDPTTGLPPGYVAPTSYPTSSGASYDGSGDGYSFTDPNVVNQTSPTTGIDPTTGLPYSQAPTAAAAPAVAPAAVAPAPSKLSWLTVAGVALAVPAFMYVSHK